MEARSGFDPADSQFAQGSLHGSDGFFARLAMDDDFGDHRIVVRRDAVAAVGMGVDADAEASWQVHRLDFAWTGLEVFIGVFGIDTAFDGCPARLDIALLEGEFLTRCDENLCFDKVDT